MRAWGLALGAGGILGFAHIGVLEVLRDKGLSPTAIAGTSAGAIVAALYSCGTSLDVVKEATFSALVENRPSDTAQIEVALQPAALTLDGIIRGDMTESLLERFLGGKRLKDAVLPVAITAVDLISGKEVVFTNDPPDKSRISTKRVYVTDARIAEAVRASISIPGVFVPKRFDGFMLVDGGIKDMVPCYEVRRMGAQEVLAVDLGGHAERPQRVTGMYAILSRSFALCARENTVATLQEHASIVIQPEVFDVGFPTPAKVRMLIEAGRIAAEKAISRWLNTIS